jgi:hypothetical protein
MLKGLGPGIISTFSSLWFVKGLFWWAWELTLNNSTVATPLVETTHCKSLTDTWKWKLGSRLCSFISGNICFEFGNVACAAHRTFRYFELCSVCLREGLGRSKPQTTLETNTNNTTVGVWARIRALLDSQNRRHLFVNAWLGQTTVILSLKTGHYGSTSFNPSPSQSPFFLYKF